MSIPSKHGMKLRGFKPYPTYQISGLDWLREMPAHWRQCRLRYVAQLSPQKREARALDPELAVSFLPMEAVGEYGGLNLNEFRLLGECLDAYTYFLEDDVLIAKITPCYENGKGALAKGLKNGIGFGTTELHVLRAGDGLIPRFLLYVTLSEHFRQLGAAAMYGAGGQKRVPEEFIRDFKHPIPPIYEQRLLVSFLDRETARIDRLLAKKERLVELLRERQDSLIEVAVRGGATDQETRLGYYVDLLPGYAFPSETFSRSPEDVRLLRGVNVSPGSVRWDDVAYWPAADSARFAPYQLKHGDLVFGMDRPWIGAGIRVAEIADADVPSLLLQRTARLRARVGLSQKYLSLVLSSPQFRAHFEPILTGVSVPHVSPAQILSFRLRLPSPAVQETLVHWVKRQVDSMNPLLEALTLSIEHLRELRMAIISDAVTGRIDVREEVA